MKSILLFLVSLASAIFSGCATGPRAHVTYNPPPPVVPGGVQHSRVITSSVPRPVSHNSDSIVVINNCAHGTYVDFYIGGEAVLSGLPAGHRATVYPRCSGEGQSLALGSVAYFASSQGERVGTLNHNRNLKMGSRRQFATVIWEVNPKGSPRITKGYSRSGYYFGR